jgi:hypothetical protein
MAIRQFGIYAIHAFNSAIDQILDSILTPMHGVTGTVSMSIVPDLSGCEQMQAMMQATLKTCASFRN